MMFLLGECFSFNKFVFSFGTLCPAVTEFLTTLSITTACACLNFIKSSILQQDDQTSF